MNLSTTMRDVLIEHLDGQLVAWARNGSSAKRLMTLRALVARGFIVPCTETGRADKSTARFTHSKMTTLGREKLGRLMGEYADALIAAGFGDLFREEYATALGTEGYEAGALFFSILANRPPRPDTASDNP